MPKATLEFNLPEENEDFKLATSAGHMYGALWDISQQVFRPARKHGYPDSALVKLCEDDNVIEAISLLEKKFYELLEERNVRL